MKNECFLSFHCNSFEQSNACGLYIRAYSSGRLSSVFGRLQDPVLLVLSSKNSRFGRSSKPSAS